MNRITDHIIFATNFSDACHAAIPTVTRWVDAHSARLTLLHVYQPEKKLHRDAESQLHSFYAEASNYAHCDRRLVSGDACAGIASFCEKEGDGLLFMPPSDRTGLPRPFHVSTRARMLETLEMPIWTMGKATLNTSAAVAGKNIAVWLQHLDESTEYVHAAAGHAQRHNATLHLLHIVPDTDEGTLLSTLYSNAPLGMESALDRLSDLASTLPASVHTELHVSMGPERRELKGLLMKSQAELLLVGQKQMLRRGTFRSTINPMLNDCTIPLICLPEQMNVIPRRVPAVRLSAA